jgi:hypothetical protein
VAAWAKDLERTLLHRKILGEPFVFYRKENGDPVTLEDNHGHSTDLIREKGSVEHRRGL